MTFSTKDLSRDQGPVCDLTDREPHASPPQRVAEPCPQLRCRHAQMSGAQSWTTL